MIAWDEFNLMRSMRCARDELNVMLYRAHDGFDHELSMVLIMAMVLNSEKDNDDGAMMVGMCVYV